MAEFVDADAEGKGGTPAADVEQLKTAIRHAIDNTTQTKAKLTQGIIDFEEGGTKEVAEARVRAIEADFAAFLDSGKKMEREFAKALKCKDHMQTKLREACIRQRPPETVQSSPATIAEGRLWSEPHYDHDSGQWYHVNLTTGASEWL